MLHLCCLGMTSYLGQDLPHLVRERREVAVSRECAHATLEPGAYHRALHRRRCVRLTRLELIARVGGVDIEAAGYAEEVVDELPQRVTQVCGANAPCMLAQSSGCDRLSSKYLVRLICMQGKLMRYECS